MDGMRLLKPEISCGISQHKEYVRFGLDDDKAFALSSGREGTIGKWLEFTVDLVWKMIRMYGEIYGHLLIKSDGTEKWKLDQEAVSSMTKLMTSYQGKLFGLFTRNEFQN